MPPRRKAAETALTELTATLTSPSRSPSKSQPPSAKESRSTLLNGNHTFPRFYACYLLQSKAVPNSNRTYVGSTPDPPRRLRQHNGELTAGAVRTRHNRPWEMQMIVYGFPSKLTALQFEWAWQKPHLSRNLRVESESEITPAAALIQAASSSDLLPPIFPANKQRQWLETKIAVVRTMLTRKPYSRLPLHVRIFTENTWQMWKQCGSGPGMDQSGQQDDPAVVTEPEPIGQKKRKKKKKAERPERPERLVKGVKRFGPFKPLPGTIDVTLDRGGVDGKAVKTQDDGMQGGPSRPKAIDVADTTFREGHWRKWQQVSGADRSERPALGRAEGDSDLQLSCGICKEAVDAKNHLTFALCPSDPQSIDCHATYHLPCLANHYLQNESAADLSATASSSSTTPPPPSPRPLLPKSGTCPSCSTPLEWGQVIRGCYTRRDGELDSVLSTEKEASKAAKKLEAEERKRAKAEEKAAAKAGGKRAVTASQVNPDYEESASDAASVSGSGGEEDDDADLMRNMLRDGESSGDGTESEEDSKATPTRKAPAKGKAAATTNARRGRGTTVGKAPTARTTRKTTTAKAPGRDGSGSESEGARLDREMMMIADSE